ncbi:MAG: sigma-70 family RNA polymerase sigma factor [Alphaproteobacteria bacterium]|nr:sigma-70 family RNA polymerase sigma factor [Alphaproteobacteria bacterium]
MDSTLPDAVELARALASVTPQTPAPEVEQLLGRLDRLFAAHERLVYATCLRYVGEPQMARDLAQDTLLKAYRKLPSFRGDAKFSTWLAAIARYECLNALRKQGETLTTDGVVDREDGSASVLASLRRQERELLLQQAAESVLDAEEQQVVWLRYGENLPLEQIEALLGTASASGARGILQRCKRKLQRELRRRLEEIGQGSSLFRESVE